MATLTLAEKKALAEEEIRQAEIMIKHHRQEEQKWVNLLEARSEYLYYIKQYLRKGLK